MSEQLGKQLPAPTIKASPDATSPDAASPDGKPKSPVTPPISPQEQRKRKLLLWGGVAVVVVLFVLLIAATIWAIQPQNQEYTRGFRDVAIIFLAFLSIIIGGLLLALVYQVTLLTILVRDEVKPLLESVNDTMNTVRGTTAFVSDNVVQPTIKVASALASVQRVFESLAGIRSSVKPKQ